MYLYPNLFVMRVPVAMKTFILLSNIKITYRDRHTKSNQQGLILLIKNSGQFCFGSVQSRP